ncbi:PAS domain-containing protein [Rhodococcus sp. NPDC127530]|uniref:PAS domain-containing protein n=1 Tax=unclassified Rhodococcus (in: high G+C Gram-positive bacteria) TaxID=192944 RepID=UPI0036271B57
MERRRPNPETALGYLEQLPVLVLLDRLPVPVLAVAQDGLVIYMNRAFEHMLGYPQDALRECSIGDLVQTVSPLRSTVTELSESAGKIVALTHRDGSTVRAAISRSTLERHDDPVILVCFQDVTEQLWGGGRAPHFE